MKGSNHAFLLLALLPVPKFIHKDRSTRGVLESRMIHECLDFILPLKRVAEIGTMMSDPAGSPRFHPSCCIHGRHARGLLLAAVVGKTSHLRRLTNDLAIHFGTSHGHLQPPLHDYMPSRKRFILGTSSHMPRLPKRENRDQLSVLDSSPTHQPSTVSWRHLETEEITGRGHRDT
jgi:hypothetical protein